jgi:predicted MPP superfamily phosphohydrolase
LPPLHLPKHVGRYVEGFYQAPAGSLYVSRGLGSSLLPLRFFCRPEMPVIRT